LEKALSDKHDRIDSVRIQKSGSPVVNVSAQVSSTIDYRELQIGKLVGSGEFAGKYISFINIYY
jgi:hypothetical protein